MHPPGKRFVPEFCLFNDTKETPPCGGVVEENIEAVYSDRKVHHGEIPETHGLRSRFQVQFLRFGFTESFVVEVVEPGGRHMNPDFMQSYSVR
jgi:hypothetical protein